MKWASLRDMRRNMTEGVPLVHQRHRLWATLLETECLELLLALTTEEHSLAMNMKKKVRRRVLLVHRAASLAVHPSAIP